MKAFIEERVVAEAKYLIKNKTTIRATAMFFMLSKSTIHNDLSSRLPRINKTLSYEVKKLLNANFEEKHIKGGISTKNMYQRIKKPRAILMAK